MLLKVVCLDAGGGRGGGGAEEEGFDCWDGAGVRWSSNVLVGSRCASCSRSMEMFSAQLFTLMVKYLAVRLMIGYGPSYGSRGFRTTSRRTKTCVAVEKL